LRTGFAYDYSISLAAPLRPEGCKEDMSYIYKVYTTLFPATALPFWLNLAALTAAELLTAYLQVMAGVICHGILLAVLTVQAALAPDRARRNLFMALCLAPLIRILSLSMPLAPIAQIYWYLIIYSPLLASTIIVMLNTGLGRRDVGLVSRGWPWQTVLGIVAGLGLGVLEYVILRPVPLATSFTLQGVLLPAIILVITTGFVEELIFRGVLQTLSERVMGLWSVLYVSLIYAVLNIGHYSLPGVAFVFLAALLFTAVVKRTGSIVGVALAHGTANAMLYCVMPFMLP
jgi:membrane protease YdiL (CAAX protease family)